MAGSRLSSHGTIFSRITGLLESGALKEVPLWYEVYRKYPPEQEPYVDRPLPPQSPIPEIVYEEDFDRVRKDNKKTEASKTVTGLFVSGRFKTDPLNHIAKSIGEKQ